MEGLSSFPLRGERICSRRSKDVTVKAGWGGWSVSWRVCGHMEHRSTLIGPFSLVCGLGAFPGVVFLWWRLLVIRLQQKMSEIKAERSSIIKQCLNCLLQNKSLEQPESFNPEEQIYQAPRPSCSLAADESGFMIGGKGNILVSWNKRRFLRVSVKAGGLWVGVAGRVGGSETPTTWTHLPALTQIKNNRF